MRVCGIIAEYNPFHNGHAYHIRCIREQMKPDYIVCVMSGSFVQRGEPALIHKWRRARAALQSGADLVLELPTAFVLSPAEHFARGGIRLLGQLGVITDISFGSECDIETLKRLAAFFLEESDEYRKALSVYLSKGLGFPAARAQAAGDCLSGDVSKALSSPNSILGIEYMRAIAQYAPQLTAHVIQRVGSYHAKHLSGALPSASAIRNAVYSSSCDDIKAAMPGEAYLSLLEALECGEGPPDEKTLSSIVFALIRRGGRPALEALPGMAEGLENRLFKAAAQARDFETLLALASGKRYTAARIRRALSCLLLDIQKGPYAQMIQSGPLYARMLGFRHSAQALVSRITSSGALPLITQPAEKIQAGLARDMLALDVRASDMRALLAPDPDKREPAQDYTHPLIVLRE